MLIEIKKKKINVSQCVKEVFHLELLMHMLILIDLKVIQSGAIFEIS
jgi:hypothetical protein